MTTDTITRFEGVIKYPLMGYLNRFLDFLSVKKGILVEYYNGNLDLYSDEVFTELKSLISESNKINDLISINVNNFLINDCWELLEMLEDIKIELQTLDKMSKWMRSSINNAQYSKGVEKEKVLKQNQSIEGLGKDNGLIDYDNDWVKIAIRNNINEEKYTPAGGVFLTLTYKNTYSGGVFVRSVVDNLFGERIYGLDIQKQLEFKNDDIKVLTYGGTMTQAAEILIGLKRGDVPEFPEDGVQANLIVGNNLAAVLYPTIFRQVYNLFSKDDTFQSISVSKIEQIDDSIRIEFNILSKLETETTQELVL